MTILATLFVLGVLIFFHELGHFLAAKAIKVKVERFSLGFGPILFRWKKKETEYAISLIPFGGYVKLAGESLRECKGSKDEFYSRSPGERMFIALAGPIMSFLLAVGIFFLLYCVGLPFLMPLVSKVLPDSPAEKAGLKSGDLILEINGRKIQSWNEMAEIIHKNPGKKISLKIKRGKDILTLFVVPKKTKTKDIFGEEKEVGVIGILSGTKTVIRRFPPWKAFWMSVKETGRLCKLFIHALKLLFTGRLSFRELCGPIGIAKIAGEEARQGLIPLLYLIGFISINLGIINLFPLPMLDGGYLLIFGVERLRKRPFSEKTMEIIQEIGIAILIFLMLLVTYNDIWRSAKERNAKKIQKNQLEKPLHRGK